MFNKKKNIEKGLPFDFFMDIDKDMLRLSKRHYMHMYSSKKYLFEQYICDNIDTFDNSFLSVTIKLDEFLEKIYLYLIVNREIKEFMIEDNEYNISKIIEIYKRETNDIPHHKCTIKKEIIECEINNITSKQTIDEFVSHLTKLTSTGEKIFKRFMIILIVLGTFVFGAFLIFGAKKIYTNVSIKTKIEKPIIVEKENDNNITIKYFLDMEFLGNIFRVQTQQGNIFTIVPLKEDSAVLLAFFGKEGRWISKNKFETTALGAKIIKDAILQTQKNRKEIEKDKQEIKKI